PLIHLPLLSILFPYTTLFRSETAAHAVGRRLHGVVVSVRPRTLARHAHHVPHHAGGDRRRHAAAVASRAPRGLSAARSRQGDGLDRKSTRLNSSHGSISYAVF